MSDREVLPCQSYENYGKRKRRLDAKNRKGHRNPNACPFARDTPLNCVFAHEFSSSFAYVALANWSEADYTSFNVLEQSSA